MATLTWRSVALLGLATCFSSISYAQNADSVEYYYEGPLDTNRPQSNLKRQGSLDAMIRPAITPHVARYVPAQHSPASYNGALSRVVSERPITPQAARSTPAQYSPAPYNGALSRVVNERPIARQAARFASAQQFREPNTGNVNTAVRATPQNSGFDINRDSFSPASISEVQSLAPPRPTQAPTFPTQTGSIEPNWSPEQTRSIEPLRQTFEEPTPQAQPFYAPQPSYSQPQPFPSEPLKYEGNLNDPQDLNQFGSVPRTRRPLPYSNLNNLPPAQDPTRFGYRDGESFGFDNTRLYNPLEGVVQLDLQGAPTVDFGPPSCDEWEGFCRSKDLDLSCNCGGLKVNPGHLGIPFLKSTDNCDQTVPRKRLRGCGCEACQTQNSCQSCGGSECSSCSGR